MITLILAAFVIIVLLLLKLMENLGCKTVKEYWTGTKVLKLKKRICYNFNNKTWVLEGPATHYNLNGTIQKELQYINDSLDGVQKHYDNNGKLLEMITYENGTFINKIIIT